MKLSGTCNRLLACGTIFFVHNFLPVACGYAQPQAAWDDYPHEVHLNQILKMTLELTWSGDADVYDIPRPDLSAIPDVRVVDQTISAARRGRANILTYGFVFQPLKQGTYDFGVMKVNYYEKKKDIATPVKVPAALVEVGPPQLFGTKAKAGIAAGAVIAFSASVSMLAFRRRMKSRKEQGEHLSSLSANRSRLLQELEEARGLLIEGDTKEYIERLCLLYESEQLRAQARRIDALRQFAESLKFSGETPSPDQLKWAEKLVKEAIEHSFPQHSDEEMN